MATKGGDTKTCNTAWCKIFIKGILMNGYLEKLTTNILTNHICDGTNINLVMEMIINY